MRNYQKDKDYVLGWMSKNCFGFRNAKTKEVILHGVSLILGNIGERYLRSIMSELKHENLIGATSSRGSWYIPPVTNDADEIMACKESLHEMKSRALDMLEDCDKHTKYWDNRLLKITQGQQELGLEGVK